MRKRDRESYNIERGNGAKSWYCIATAESKEENIQDMKWRLADRRTGGRAKRIGTRKVKQEDVTRNRTEFRLRERGAWDECEQVLKLVWCCEEFVDGKIRCTVRGEEDVWYIVQGHEIRNIFRPRFI